MYRRWVAGAFALGGALLGCFVVTGGTDGYQRVPDASQIECLGTVDCNPGEICCGTLTGSPLSASATCQTGTCSVVQLCTTHAECRVDGGIGCAAQECTFDGSAFTLQACSTFPACAFK